MNWQDDEVVSEGGAAQTNSFWQDDEVIKQPDTISDFESAIGRTGRAFAAGVPALLDVPRVVTNPLFETIGQAADLMGAEGVRDYSFGQVKAPYFSERGREAFDVATDNAYTPRNTTEKVQDFASEFLVTMMTPAALQKLGQAGIDALSKAGNSVANFFSKSGKVDKGTQRAVNILLEEGKTPDEIVAIAEQAKKQPIPTTLFEQAQSPKGLAMQRALSEQPNQAGTVLSKFNEGRVAKDIPQVTQAVASKGAETSSPLVAGTRIKSIADEIIKDAISARKTATAPLYEAQKNVPLVFGKSGIDDLKVSDDFDPKIVQELQNKVSKYFGAKHTSSGALYDRFGQKTFNDTGGVGSKYYIAYDKSGAPRNIRISGHSGGSQYTKSDIDISLEGDTFMVKAFDPKTNKKIYEKELYKGKAPSWDDASNYFSNNESWSNAIKSEIENVSRLIGIKVNGGKISLIDRLVEKNPAIAAAARRVDTNPELQQLLRSEGVERNSAAYLEKVRSELSRVAQVATKDITKLDRQSAAGAKNAIDVIDKVLKKRAPGIIQAREEFAMMSPEVTALQKGIVGRIATAKNPEKAADMLMQEAPETISNVRNMFLKKDPQAWQNLTSSLLNQKAILAEDSLAKYLSSVDKALIKPKMKAMLTPSQYKAQRLLVANLRAIQKGLPRNSETVAKTLATAELEGAGGAEVFTTSVTSGRGVNEMVGQFLFWLGKTTKSKMSQQSKLALSEAITSPNIEAIGKALEKVKPGSKAAIDIIEPYLLPYIAASGEAPKLIKQNNTTKIESKPQIPQPLPEPQSSIDPADVELLKGNPGELSSLFDEKYGQGAADSILNGGQQPIPEELVQDEGKVLSSYVDTTGNRTVGIGFNMDSGIAKRVWKQAGIGASFDDVYRGKSGISEMDAESLAQASYQIAREDAEKLVPKFHKLSENRKQAILNLSYQLGYNGLAGFKKFKSAIDSGDFKLAARELVLSDWWSQTQDSRKRRIVQQVLIG